LGVDLSARMLERARERSAAEGIANVRFVQADAQVHPFDDTFDVAISSFGAMFFADPVAAFGNIGGALRPGGRLAILAWRELARNEWLTMLREALALGRDLPQPPPSAPGPFGFADPDHVRRVLDAAGLENVHLEPIEEPVNFGADADDAFSFVRTLGIVEGLTNDLDADMKAQALEQVHRALKAHDTGDGVLVGSSAWLITARRP
jgi:SAM-dependent methyltransferase